jgi:predicted Zn-ribbon and HTH transcriptional regulator
VIGREWCTGDEESQKQANSLFHGQLRLRFRGVAPERLFGPNTKRMFGRAKTSERFWPEYSIFNQQRMFRKDLIDILLGNAMSVVGIARMMKEAPADIADDLNHLLRSLKHTEYKAVIEPAHCRACGFEFSAEKLTKPSKCPQCHSTWLQEPKIRIELKGGDSA